MTRDREEAFRVLRDVLRVKPGMIRTMPPGRRVTQSQADRLKAAQMVSQEILDSIARCEALEQEANQ